MANNKGLGTNWAEIPTNVLSAGLLWSFSLLSPQEPRVTAEPAAAVVSGGWTGPACCSAPRALGPQGLPMLVFGLLGDSTAVPSTT